MIPLYKPFMPDLPEMNTILQSGQLAYGEYSRKFEQALRTYFGTEYVMVVSTFQFAIDVAMSALGVKSGDEVIASPMACLASTQPLVSYGLKVVWGDVDNHRGTLDPKSVQEKITSNTKCIFHNHFCGYPGYIDEINKLAHERGIAVIDDGIECFGSEYHGKKIGLYSDAAVFSLSPARIPNTIDGGVIIFKNKDRFEQGLLIRDYGVDRTRFRDEMGEINNHCDINLKGYSAMPSNVQGYIGYKQMDNVEGLIARQRKRAQKWERYFKDKNVLSLNAEKQNNPNYWVYGVYVQQNKKEFILDYREHGYYVSGVHINNNRYSVFGQKVELPATEDFYNHFVALPCGWWVEGMENEN